MSKLTLAGILHEVGIPTESNQKVKYQNIVLLRKRFDHETGELKEESFFPMVIFNKKIDEIKAIDLKGKQVIIECYLSGRKHTNDEGKNNYFLSLNCTKIEPKI